MSELLDLPKERIAELLSGELNDACDLIKELAGLLSECEDILCGESTCEAHRNAVAWLEEHGWEMAND